MQRRARSRGLKFILHQDARSIEQGDAAAQGARVIGIPEERSATATPGLAPTEGRDGAVALRRCGARPGLTVLWLWLPTRKIVPARSADIEVAGEVIIVRTQLQSPTLPSASSTKEPRSNANGDFVGVSAGLEAGQRGHVVSHALRNKAMSASPRKWKSSGGCAVSSDADGTKSRAEQEAVADRPIFDRCREQGTAVSERGWMMIRSASQA